HRNEPASIGKIDVDVTEVGFESLPWIVGQRNERLAMVASMLADVATNLIVAALIAMLLAQAPPELHGRVALLGRRILVSSKDGVDRAVKGAEHRCRRRLSARVRPRLPLRQNL